MQRDLGSRDLEFIEAVKFVRSGLLKVAGVTPEEWTVVPMQVKPIKHNPLEIFWKFFGGYHCI